MQQKIDTMTKEAFDLQETLLWKDKSLRVGGEPGLWSFRALIDEEQADRV